MTRDKRGGEEEKEEERKRKRRKEEKKEEKKEEGTEQRKKGEKNAEGERECLAPAMLWRGFLGDRLKIVTIPPAERSDPSILPKRKMSAHHQKMSIFAYTYLLRQRGEGGRDFLCVKCQEIHSAASEQSDKMDTPHLLDREGGIWLCTNI